MAKETSNYFSHDYNSRNDPKLVKVLMVLGQEGKGVYWDLVEMLYEQNGYLKLSEYDSITFALRTNYDLLNKLISDFNLFKKDDEKFWSESVLRRLELRKAKSEKAKESISRRWNNTDVLRTKNERNTIKERKGKEKKRNNSSGTNTTFVKPSVQEVTKYFNEEREIPLIKSQQLAEGFCDHFESNGWKVGGKSKMKDWKAAARRWQSNDTKFHRAPQTPVVQMPKAYPYIVRKNDYKDDDEFNHFLNEARKKIGYEPEIAA